MNRFRTRGKRLEAKVSDGGSVLGETVTRNNGRDRRSFPGKKCGKMWQNGRKVGHGDQEIRQSAGEKRRCLELALPPPSERSMPMESTRIETSRLFSRAQCKLRSECTSLLIAVRYFFAHSLPSTDISQVEGSEIAPVPSKERWVQSVFKILNIRTTSTACTPQLPARDKVS